MKYNEIRKRLNSYRSIGVELQVSLNSKKELLEKELERVEKQIDIEVEAALKADDERQQQQQETAEFESCANQPSVDVGNAFESCANDKLDSYDYDRLCVTGTLPEPEHDMFLAAMNAGKQRQIELSTLLEIVTLVLLLAFYGWVRAAKYVYDQGCELRSWWTRHDMTNRAIRGYQRHCTACVWTYDTVNQMVDYSKRGWRAIGNGLELLYFSPEYRRSW